MEQPEAPRAHFPNYLRAFYPFHPAEEISPQIVTLPLDQGEIILVHSIHTNGWADGTSLDSGNRGWLPTNYCEEYDELIMRPLLKEMTDFWDIIRGGVGPSLKDFGNQDLMRGLIAGVRSLLEKSDCSTREAPLVKKYTGVRETRRDLLSGLSSLVKTIKQFQEITNRAPAEDEVEAILDEMLLQAFKVVTRGVRFLDVWNEEVGLSRRIEETETAGSQHNVPSMPAPAIFSLTDTAPISNPYTEQSASRQINHDRADSGITSMRTEALDRQSLMPASTQRVSLSDQVSHPGLSLAVPTQNLASQRLATSYDDFLDVLGNLIDVHKPTHSAIELIGTNNRAVQYGRKFLYVIEEICQHDVQRSAPLAEARESVIEELYEVVHAARDVFSTPDSPDKDLVFMPDEATRLVNVATDCVHAAGKCLAKARLVLEQIGDLELHPIQDDPGIVTSQASCEIPAGQAKQQELSTSLPPSPLTIPSSTNSPPTRGLAERIGDVELNPQSLASAMSLDQSDATDLVLAKKFVVDQDFSTTIGSVSQYASDRIFSAGQPSTLDRQTALTAITDHTAPICSEFELETEDLRTIYSDTLTMVASIKESYINELAIELSKAVSTFRLDSTSMKRVADALPGCLKAFSSRLGCISSSQQAQRDVTVFIHKYRQ